MTDTPEDEFPKNTGDPKIIAEKMENMQKVLAILVDGPISAFYSAVQEDDDIKGSDATAIVMAALLKNLGYTLAIRAHAAKEGRRDSLIARDLKALVEVLVQATGSAYNHIIQNNPEFAHKDEIQVRVKGEVRTHREYPEGTEGQDRESYSDDQDRESYYVPEGTTKH